MTGPLPEELGEEDRALLSAVLDLDDADTVTGTGTAGQADGEETAPDVEDPVPDLSPHVQAYEEVLDALTTALDNADHDVDVSQESLHETPADTARPQATSAVTAPRDAGPGARP